MVTEPMTLDRLADGLFFGVVMLAIGICLVGLHVGQVERKVKKIMEILEKR